MKTSLFLTTALTAFLVAGAANAEKIKFAANDLAGDHEIPAVESGATGSAVLTFDTDTKKLCGKITFTPSTFEGTEARIHEGDDKKEDGESKITLAESKFTGELKVNKTLTDEEATALTTGDNYINIYSEGHTTGELRDQLVVDESAEEQTCDDATTGDDDDDSDAGTGTGTGNGDGSGDGSGKDAGSSSGDTKTADSTDDGGCNTSGSSSGNALALLAGLGAVIVAASRKRKKA